MASPSELSLECKPHTQSYSMLLKSFGDNLKTDQLQKLEDFVSRLEEELHKIDAFKRELPLCMQLLTNAVEVYRQQLHAYRANNNNNNNQQNSKPILEEFIPLRNFNAENNNAENNSDNKANWMMTAQLWSKGGVTGSGDRNATTEIRPNVLSTTLKENTDIAADSPKLGLLDAKQRNGGGAFLPFSREQRTLPELALSSSINDDKEIEDIKRISGAESGKSLGNGNYNGLTIEHTKGQNGNLTDEPIAIHGNKNNNNSNAPAAATGGAATTTTSQTHRKPRRCWSPDLHRRFVNALQMLGGSQVATPKQIRELMKVDGLTNDEVKSHLQKYRLHTRRPSPSQAAGGPAPQLVVLGGIWVPPEYATTAAAAHGGNSAIYHHHHHHHPAATTTHHPQPHFFSQPIPHEFYSTAATPPPLPPAPPLHQHHQALHPYSKSSASPDSPDPRGGGGERLTDSGEEGKSEGSSWKAADSGGERRGLAALKEEGEVSNGSEITLKF